MATALFGVTWFDQSHTAGNIMEASVLMAEWGITSKVWRILLCTHTQSYYKEAVDQIPAVGSEARKIVGLFRSSHKARDKLMEMQGLVGRPPLKLIQGWRRDGTAHLTCCNSCMTNVSQLAALSNLNSDIFPLTSSEYGVIHECTTLLEPLKFATTRL